MKPPFMRVGIGVAVWFQLWAGVAAGPQESTGRTLIVVSVRDASGGYIAGAQITIDPLPPGLNAPQETDAAGAASMQLPPGSYDLKVSFPGFRSQTKHIEMKPGAEQTVEFILSVGRGHLFVERPDPTAGTAVAPVGGLVAQCSDRDFASAIPPTDPTYSEARKFGSRLDVIGLRVRCVLTSKMRRIFAGQTGAAFYRTEAGDLDALFLPPSDVFDQLEIVERHQGSRYLYSFRGTPRSKVRMNAFKRAYFIKSHNVLIYVLGDERLADTLRVKLSE